MFGNETEIKITDVISASDFGHCWILKMKKSRDFSILLYIDFVYCFIKENCIDADNSMGVSDTYTDSLQE